MSIGVNSTTSGDFRIRQFGTFLINIFPPVVTELPTNVSSSMGFTSTFCLGETSEFRDPVHSEGFDTSALVSLTFDITMMRDPPSFKDFQTPIEMPGLVPEGVNYQLEIYHKHSSASHPRNHDMQDYNIILLRDVISRLTPRSPESLDRFIPYDNDTLYILVSSGLEEDMLRY